MAVLTSGARTALAAILALCGLLVPAMSGAVEGRGYVELDGVYKTGDFGTSTTSSLYALSPTLGYIAPRYHVSVTAPLVSLSLESGGVKRTETGLGDVVLRAGAMLLPETGGGSSISAAVAVKLPTADEANGLGTGQTDYGVFAGLHQRFMGLKLSLTGGYIVTGDPGDFSYKNIPLVGVGVAKVFSKTNVFASLEGRGAAVAGADDPLEASVGAFHLLSSDYALIGSATFGLNDGGPAFGGTLGVVRWL